MALWLVYVEAGRFDVDFRSLYYYPARWVFDLFVEAGRFEVEFRLGHMGIWPGGLLIYVCGCWYFNMGFRSPYCHLARWTFRCFLCFLYFLFVCFTIQRISQTLSMKKGKSRSQTNLSKPTDPSFRDFQAHTPTFYCHVKRNIRISYLPPSWVW